MLQVIPPLMYGLRRHLSISIFVAYIFLEVLQSELSSTLDNVPRFEPWLKPNCLAGIRKANSSCVRYVLWMFGNITDSETLDAVIRLAGSMTELTFAPPPMI